MAQSPEDLKIEKMVNTNLMHLSLYRKHVHVKAEAVDTVRHIQAGAT